MSSSFRKVGELTNHYTLHGPACYSKHSCITLPSSIPNINKRKLVVCVYHCKQYDAVEFFIINKSWASSRGNLNHNMFAINGSHAFRKIPFALKFFSNCFPLGEIIWDWKVIIVLKRTHMTGHVSMKSNRGRIAESKWYSPLFFFRKIFFSPNISVFFNVVAVFEEKKQNKLSFVKLCKIEKFNRANAGFGI